MSWYRRLLPWLPWRPVQPWLPEGNGMFVSRLRKLSLINDRVKRGKLRWVAVLRDFHDADGSGQRTEFNRSGRELDIIHQLQDAGLDLVAWSYPYPGQEREYVDSLCDAVHQWGAKSIMVDPEAPYTGRTEGHPRADVLNAMMRDAADRLGVSYGFSSYGGVWNFDEPVGVFPFAAFTGCDYAIPQTYTYRKGYVARAWDAYEAKGFDRSKLVGAFGTYRNSLSQLGRLLGDSREAGARALIGWKWETTNLAEFDLIGDSDNQGRAA